MVSSFKVLWRLKFYESSTMKTEVNTVHFINTVSWHLFGWNVAESRVGDELSLLAITDFLHALWLGVSPELRW